MSDLKIRHFGTDSSDPSDSLMTKLAAHGNFVSCAGAVLIDCCIGTANAGADGFQQNIMGTTERRGLFHD